LPEMEMWDIEDGKRRSTGAGSQARAGRGIVPRATVEHAKGEGVVPRRGENWRETRHEGCVLVTLPAHDFLRSTP